MTLPKETDIDLETENVTSAATSIMVSLCKVGADLTARKNDKGLMDKLTDNYADSLPSNESACVYGTRLYIFAGRLFGFFRHPD